MLLHSLPKILVCVDIRMDSYIEPPVGVVCCDSSSLTRRHEWLNNMNKALKGILFTWYYISGMPLSSTE